MEPIRLGIIGCGVIGTNHVASATKSPLVELIAVADVMAERARATAEKFGVPSFYNNDEDLLNNERIEAVWLAMPTGVRTPIAFKTLKKGKHVIIEKPAASKASEIEEMMQLRGDRVVACCSPRCAFSGHAEAAAKCVASGALGKIRVVRVRAIGGTPPNPSPNPPPWRQSMKLNGGGILVNWSCYDLDYLMQIVNWQLRPRVVLAKWWPVAAKMSAYVAPGSDADSHYTAFILCDNDIVLTMERAEFSSAANDQAWEIIGEEGTLHMPMTPQKGKPNAVILDKFVPGEGIVSEAIWEEGQGGGSEGGVLEDFVHAVREKKEPKTTLERALVMQKITDAIYASTKTGEAVYIY
ncbi:Gfo/Idh/MocA family oxidoreductase [Candidatus Poribacteria bacterium]|nr:Gfo/Idh/MocA family oxidoreductase [Candidatus Poribacteria bacterium]